MAKEKADKVTITWPDGTENVFENVNVLEVNTFVRDEDDNKRPVKYMTVTVEMDNTNA